MSVRGVRLGAHESLPEAPRRRLELRGELPALAPLALPSSTSASSAAEAPGISSSRSGAGSVSARGGRLVLEGEPGEQQVDLVAHLPELVMEAIHRRAQRAQRVGVVAEGAGLEQREQLAIELGWRSSSQRVRKVA